MNQFVSKKHTLEGGTQEADAIPSQNKVHPSQNQSDFQTNEDEENEDRETNSRTQDNKNEELSEKSPD